jgi:hypothetical protein
MHEENRHHKTKNTWLDGANPKSHILFGSTVLLAWERLEERGWQQYILSMMALPLNLVKCAPFLSRDSTPLREWVCVQGCKEQIQNAVESPASDTTKTK